MPQLRRKTSRFQILLARPLRSKRHLSSGRTLELARIRAESSLGRGVSCTVSIAFTPTASGARSGTFSITDDAGTQTALLSGIGTSPATDAISPPALTFAAQQLSTASPAQQVTVTNSGDLPLTLIAAQITSGDFSVVNACGNSLNPHSSCSINVTFQPKSVGTITGVLSVSDQYRTQTVGLYGIGVAPPGVTLSPVSTITFTATGVGLMSAAQTVTLTNNGAFPLFVQGVTVAGDFVIVPGSDTCGSTVAVSTACTLQIAFAPTVAGPRSGSLTITDNAANSPQVLSLTGTGVDFALSPNGGTSLTVANGQNAVYPLLLSSAANIPGTATFTCTGAPANSTCTVTPASVALGSTTTVLVTVLTGVTSTAASARPHVYRTNIAWFATLFPLSLLALRRSRRSCLVGLVLVGCLTAATGCGAGRAIPLESGSNPNPTPIPITPAGTYTVVASATSGGLTRSVNLTLIVQ